MHRGPRHGGRSGGHRPRGHRPTVRISSGRNRHYGSGRSFSRGIFRIIISALFFRSITNMAKNDPERARSTCSRISSIGKIMLCIGLIMFIAPIFAFITSTDGAMSSGVFAIIVIGMIMLLFGSAMSSEAAYVSRNCYGDNFDNDSQNFQQSSQQNTQQVDKKCAYCGTTNPSTNNYCNACGASL